MCILDTGRYISLTNLEYINDVQVDRFNAWTSFNILQVFIRLFWSLIFYLLRVGLLWNVHLSSNDLSDCVNLIWSSFIFKRLWITVMIAYFHMTLD